MNRQWIIILSLVAIAAYAWPLGQRIFTEGQEPGTFVIHSQATPTTHAEPFVQEEFINPANRDGMVHVASICELAEGRLAAAWYGGSREGAGDVSILFSTRELDKTASWSEPKVIVDRRSASRELDRYVKKVGNPVLFTGSDGRLWLMYVTIAAGGWSGSSLNIAGSDDDGTTWGRSRRLTLSPFFNISELVRNRPALLTTGGIAVPIYHECIGNFSEILWFQAGQEGMDIRIRKSRMTGGDSYIQPSIVPFSPSMAAAFYRCRTEARAIGRAVTRNAGASWSRPQGIELSNPDAGVAALPLSDQRVLLAFNDSKTNRESLCLALSDDRGLNWRRIAILEQESNREFSYPYMIRTRDGRIHLVYTWDRKRIKHMIFNDAWIEKQTKRKSY